MTGVITSLPPLVEQPPGNNASNPAGLPGLTYTVAVLGIPQTWTALQTFPLGKISVQFGDVVGLAASATTDTTNAANITSGTLPAGRLPALTGDVTMTAGTSATTLAAGNASNLNSGTLLAARMPALTGDVTTSAGTVVAAIAANAVTNAKLATMAAWTFKANNTSGSATPTDITIDGLTLKATPASTDEVIIWDVAGAALKKATVSGVGASSGVSSIAANTGAFTLSNGITNSTNDIRLATISTGQMLANTTGATAVPVATAIPVYHASQFLTNGTFTTPANSTTATVYRYRMVGAGGGGGGTGGSATGGSATGGGGAGAYVEGTFTGVAASTAITITISNTGGAGGANTGATGTTGGSSSIGAPVTISAGGGTGGAGINAAGASTSGGAGGTSTGSPNIISNTGGTGETGIANATAANRKGGNGANSPLGEGGKQTPDNNGASGIGFGSGGAGTTNSTAVGGAGAPGICIIEWVL